MQKSTFVSRLLRIVATAGALAILLAQPGSLAVLGRGDAAGRAAAAPRAGSYDWLQFNGDPQHSGNNTSEATIGRNNVSTLHQIFQITLPDVADGAPAYLSGVGTRSGTRDLVFLTTRDGHIFALDAHTGTQIWAHQYGPGGCRINGGSGTCYTTSSPAVDPNRQFVYSYGLDGYVHKYQVGNGSEIRGGGWPELATRKSSDEKGSSALAIATAGNGNTYLYVTNGGYPGDQGDYQGHITAINLGDGSQNVFNANCSDHAGHLAPGSCSDVQSAIWARAGVVYDAGTDRIYATTGNGTFDPAKHMWGDTVFSLNPDGTGANGDPLGTYTPPEYKALQDADADLGSTAPAILHVPGGSNYAHLALQTGKDGKVRVLNLDQVGPQRRVGRLGGSMVGTFALPQGDGVFTAPAVWTNPSDGSNWVFIATGNGVAAFVVTVNGGWPGLQLRWTRGSGSTSPIVANGVLYLAGNGNIRAWDPTTGKELWKQGIGAIHWESPIVANGVLYITDEGGHLSAFAPS